MTDGREHAAEIVLPEGLLRRGRQVLLTSANSDYASELVSLHERSAEFHKPWVFHATIERYLQKLMVGRTIGLFLWAAEGQSLVGVINLNEPVPGAFKSAYLGYYIDVDFAGKGYMTEGLGLALDYAFGELDFHRLEANIQPANAASIALVKRLGFRLEGYSPRYLCINDVWCDHERWAILSDEWKSNT